MKRKLTLNFEHFEIKCFLSPAGDFSTSIVDCEKRNHYWKLSRVLWCFFLLQWISFHMPRKWIKEVNNMTFSLTHAFPRRCLLAQNDDKLFSDVTWEWVLWTCPEAEFGHLTLDMRQYYFTNTDMGDGTLKSELILLRTNLDDNGTFQCVAENRAGVAVANFTLNVVVPVPPKPPQAEKNILL